MYFDLLLQSKTLVYVILMILCIETHFNWAYLQNNRKMLIEKHFISIFQSKNLVYVILMILCIETYFNLVYLQNNRKTFYFDI
jgi:hypothetical protein